MGCHIIGHNASNLISEISIARTLETTYQERKEAIHLSYTTNIDKIADCNIYIITVPTPVDSHKVPDLTHLEKASKTVGKVYKRAILLFMNLLYIQALPKIFVFHFLKKNQG